MIATPRRPRPDALSLTWPLLAAGLLAGCATNAPQTVPQQVFAMQDALTVAEHTAVDIAPLLTPAQLQTMKHLDQQAYQAKQPIVRAAQSDTPATAVQMAAASEALSAFSTFLNQHSPATPATPVEGTLP